METYKRAAFDDQVEIWQAGKGVDRIESINQQLDYAQATMQSLKDDAQHQHSTFLEYTIVILLGFEVLVEMHALGWIDLTPFGIGKRDGGGAEASER